jgi:hypothetical protein
MPKPYNSTERKENLEPIALINIDVKFSTKY